MFKFTQSAIGIVGDIVVAGSIFAGIKLISKEITELKEKIPQPKPTDVSEIVKELKYKNKLKEYELCRDRYSSNCWGYVSKIREEVDGKIT